MLLSQGFSALANAASSDAAPTPIASRDFTLVDQDRVTPTNGGRAASPERKLKTTVWYPAQRRALEFLQPGPPPVEPAAGPRPLVIYSHGFMSYRKGAHYLIEHLARRGYVVAAADFPLTRTFAPGGPLLDDVINQPGDVSFLIDTLLAWNADPSSAFHQAIDPKRIALVGVSLGGMTTTLAAFHPTLRDPRVVAAASVAGPTAMFAPLFFRDAEVGFLLVAASEDAMIDYDSNASDLLERAPRATLVTLRGGSHTAFAGFADPFLAWMHNPDSIGCWAIEKGIPDDSDLLERLGGSASGIRTDQKTPPCQVDPLPRSLRPKRQQQLTILAVSSFFESQLAKQPAKREAAKTFLMLRFAEENQEISVLSTNFPPGL